jgi:hypothetical protein
MHVSIIMVKTVELLIFDFLLLLYLKQWPKTLIFLDDFFELVYSKFSRESDEFFDFGLVDLMLTSVDRSLLLK